MKWRTALASTELILKSFEIREINTEATLEASEPKISFKNFNLMLEEGMTDKIALEVYLEYTRRHPNAVRPLVAKASLTVPEKGGTMSYDVARRVVTAMTMAIAKETGVPEDVVWRGFVKQYFSGEARAIELYEMFSEMFSKDFVEKLGNASDGPDLYELLLANRKVGEHYPDAAKKWLEHLDISRGAK